MTIISTSRRVTPATGEPGEFITPDVCDASPAFTDHMFSMVYSPEAGWLKPQLLPLEPLSLHPATSALYNGQFVFEDVTAHRRVDGSIAVFRPWDHARRLRQSASRLAMPELPDDLFVAAVEELLEADGTRLTPPTDVNGAGSPTAASATLHLRALMFGTDVLSAPIPADHFRFVVTASPMSGASTVTANRAADDVTDGIAVMVNHEHGRALPGGTGEANAAGNHAPTFLARRRALEAGCQEVLWLDAAQRCRIEGLSELSLFVVRGNSARPLVSTPELGGTIPPDVARDSVLLLAARMGYLTKQERLTLGRWRTERERGVITEMFGCNAVAGVVPITKVHDARQRPEGEADVWTVGKGRPGPVTTAISRALSDVQHGIAPAPRGWLHQIPADD